MPALPRISRLQACPHVGQHHFESEQTQKQDRKPSHLDIARPVRNIPARKTLNVNYGRRIYRKPRQHSQDYQNRKRNEHSPPACRRVERSFAVTHRHYTAEIPHNAAAKINGAQGRIRTSVALSAADLQSAAINHSATCASFARHRAVAPRRMERGRPTGWSWRFWS